MTSARANVCVWRRPRTILLGVAMLARPGAAPHLPGSEKTTRSSHVHISPSQRLDANRLEAGWRTTTTPHPVLLLGGLLHQRGLRDVGYCSRILNWTDGHIWKGEPI